VEERLKFYDTGAAPRKNVDVMEEVRRELQTGTATGGEASGAGPSVRGFGGVRGGGGRAKGSGLDD
jgi:hypothetical protein